MNDVKLQTLEDTFKSEFSTERFTRFTREFFNNVVIVSPNKENDHIYAEYKFTIASYTHIANYTDENKKRMGIFSIKLQNNRRVERSRGIQRNFVSKLMDLGNLDAALVAFYCDSDPVWRLSFIRLDYEFIAGRVKKNLTPAKRFSYLVGKDEPCHTAVEQLFPIFKDDQFNPTIDRVEAAFSVQSVTDKFFKEYKEKYLDVKEFLDKSNDFCEQAKLHHFTSEQFAKKLMGQIAFLYFIQKKGWLGVKAIPSKINKKDYEKAYYRFGKSSREVVNKLFVQTEEDEYTFNITAFKDFSEDELNIAGECFEPEAWGSGSRNFMYDMYEVYNDKKKNYFNEFLEPLFYDALNKKRGGNQYYSKLNKRIPFLNGGLFQPLDNYDWKRNDFSIPNFVFSNREIKGRDADGILDIFSKYNFTVNENEPFECEVAVDPEMLGKIFENLLDVRDRKSKGTFYTPREIVSYMCKESLIYYLINKTGICQEDIREFILYGEIMRDFDCSKEGKESGNLQIPKAVFEHLIDIDQALVDVKIADPAVGSGAFPLGMVNEIVRIRANITDYLARELSQREARLLHTGERHPYWLKRKAIESSIYAVDIDESAVDIAKLRLWLSLVVDDEINPDADSTTILETARRDPHTLPNLDCHVLCGNSLVDEIDGVKLFNESILYGELQSNEWQVSSLMQSQYDTLLKKLFDAQDNLYSVDSIEQKEELKKQISAITDKLIRVNLNPQLGVASSTVKKYEESIGIESKPYFIWKLEFGKVFKDHGGFDIVIGNPPYINMVNIEEKQRKYLQKNYVITKNKIDLYAYFIEMSNRIMNDHSHLAFIIPQTWKATDSFSKFREFIFTNFIVKQIVNLEMGTFEAVVRPLILFIEKESISKTDYNISIYSNQFKKIDEIAFIEVKESGSYIIDTESTKDFKSIFKSIEKNSIPLGEILQFTRGIKTSNDNKFVLKDIIDINCKKVFRGKNIKRYERNWAGEYIWYRPDLMREKVGCVPHTKELFEVGEKIITQRVNSSMQLLAAYDNEGHYYLDTTIVSRYDTLDNNYKMKYLLALLNSKVVNFWYCNKYRMPTIGLYELHSIPIKSANTNDQIELEKLVDLIHESKLKSDSALEKTSISKIDEFVYKLYNLTEQEIMIIERNCE